MPSKPDPSIPITYFSSDEVTSPKFAKAFAQGCGGKATNNTDLITGPFAAFGTPPSWPLFESAKADGWTWYYGDHGYWGRGQVYRIGKNVLQFQPTDADLKAATPKQFGRYHAPIASWKKDGSHIVVCPNSDVYMRKHTGLGLDDWVAMVTATVQQHTNRPVISRSKKTKHPIGMDLEDAHACVVFSSASAVDAMQAGVPVFVLAPWCSSARMGLSDLSKIETPIRPDNREPFFWALAEQQWTLEEIARGEAWRHLNAR